MTDTVPAQGEELPMTPVGAAAAATADDDDGTDNPAFANSRTAAAAAGEEETRVEIVDLDAQDGAPEYTSKTDNEGAADDTQLAQAATVNAADASEPRNSVDNTDIADEQTEVSNMNASPVLEVETEQVETPMAASSIKEQRVVISNSANSGYDTVVEATRLWATDPKEPVKLRMTDEGPGAERPITVPSMLMDTVSKIPQHTALAAQSAIDAPWQTWTYAQYLADVKVVAKGFIKLGLEPYHAVGILGFNAPEWHLSLLGAIFAGGIGCGIYTTNSADACRYVLEDSHANIAVVEDEVQLKKILAVRQDLPYLKAIIQYRGQPAQQHEDVYSFSQLREMAKTVDDETLEARLHMCSPNKCCSLIYTSGTTGPPKGAMLSHDNITWTAKMTKVHCRFRWAKEITISYLPLSHIAAQLTDIFLAITAGGTIHFAQPDALKGTLSKTIQQVRPTLFLGVPRVWEKFQEVLRNLGRENKGCKKKIADKAKASVLKGNLAVMNGQSMPLSARIFNALVFKKLHKKMGFDRCWAFYSGAAPLNMDTTHYFMSLNIPITEIYGMSESTGPQHIGVSWNYQAGTVGPVFHGATTELKDNNGNAEVCFSGRHVFMGYVRNEEKTRETIDDEGWLHSGDVGKWDDSGRYLSITGRIKELIITAGGENVAPVLIEDAVKSELLVVSNCMLIGDRRKFLSILLTLKTVVNPDTLVPTDQLAPDALEWVASVGSRATTLSEILNNTDEHVMRGIQAGIDRANKKAISRAQKIQKWSILPVDFSVPGGELGPSLKLKRPVVHKQYAKTIDSFYTGT